MNTEDIGSLYKLIATRERARRVLRALVGDGCGNVAVDGMDNFVWVRPFGRESPVRAYCPGGLLAHNTLVNVEVISTGAQILYYVIGADYAAYGYGELPAGLVTTAPHHSQHEFPAADTVYVHELQFTPLLMYPTSPPSMQVGIKACTWWYNGVPQRWESGESEDLTSRKPAAGYARFVMLYLDAATAELRYKDGPEFAATLWGGDTPHRYVGAAPSNSIVIGVVLLLGTSISLTWNNVHSLRNFYSPPGPSGVSAVALLLATNNQGLHKSVGGQRWTPVLDADEYLMAGVHFVVAVDEDEWVVFREQATAGTTDPLVYRTSDGGVTWAKSQDGMSLATANTWRVWAIWYDKADPSSICVLLGYVSASTFFKIYATSDGGLSWDEITNNIPSFTPTSARYPTCISVEHTGPGLSSICVGFSQDGLYYPTLIGWQQRKAGAIGAIETDVRNEGCWFATSGTKFMFTDDNWITYDEYDLDMADQFGVLDVPSITCPHIYQHPDIPQHIAVGGELGVHVSEDGGESFTLIDNMRIGQVENVLSMVHGSTENVVYFVANGVLHYSNDGCTYSVTTLNLSNVRCVSGFTSRNSDTVLRPRKVFDIWLKG